MVESRGLSTITTTSARNGYPQDLKTAIVGFDTFDEAEQFAKENDMELQIFHRHDGWQFWVRDNNRAWEAFDAMKWYDGDGYELLTNQDVNTFYDDRIVPIVKLLPDDCDTIDELVGAFNCFIQSEEKIYNELSAIGADEFMVVDGSEIEGVYKKHCMEIDYDSKQWIIGAIQID